MNKIKGQTGEQQMEHEERWGEVRGEDGGGLMRSRGAKG